jgi:signal transduction histidine kinase/ActR/RegA family two-component response regulator
MTLRRPVLILVLAALLPLVVLSGALGFAWLRSEQDALEADARNRANHLSALISHELAAHSAVIRSLAQVLVLDEPVNEAAFSEVALRFLREQPQWISVRLSAPSGQIILDVPTRQQGSVVDEASHRRAVEEKRVIVGSILRGPRGRAAFTVRAPVIRAGAVTSVVTAVVGPDSLRETLLSQGLPADWIAAVVDSEGRIVARSTGDQALVGGLATESARAAIQSGPAGSYEGKSLTGLDVITTYRVLPAAGWSVHVAIPTTAYRAPLVRSMWLLGAATALSLLLVATFIWLLMREMRLRRREEAGFETARRMEALGRMTGGIAHDFNNLLQILHGGAELLKRRRHDPERVNSLADGLLNAAMRGRTLTRQLLAFAGRSSHSPVAFDLRERAADLLTLLKRSTREDVTTVISVPDATWPIQADPDALEVALINLAVNARDAMPSGGKLTIGATNVSLHRGRDDEPGLQGDFVALTVQDTGAGIGEEHLSHIFEPFYTTKPPGQGTGLGLSQVYGFARQSGGAVTVATEVGIGSTFTLYLPRASQPVVRVAVSEEPSPLAEQGRVLLVEDNPEVGQVTEAMLSSIGYSVTRANSGPEALHLLDRPNAEFDVVLSDIVMEGGMSGLDLAPRILERRPGMPIVLMTGYSDALRRGSQLGLPVVSKPFRLAEVAAALSNARREAEQREPRRNAS